MSTLIQCKTCQFDIAISAKNCPKCGALNNFQHPEIARFLNNQSSLLVPKLSFLGTSYWTIHTGVQLTILVRKQSWWRVGYHWGKAFWLLVFIMYILISDRFHLKMLEIHNDWIVHAWLEFHQIYGPLAVVILVFYSMLGFFLSFGDIHSPQGLDDADGYFIIDFSETPPKWKTNDLVIWNKAIKYFNLS